LVVSPIVRLAEAAFVDVPFSPPAKFDGFTVERPLGRGGMGHVYLGRDLELDRLVALKFVAARDASTTAHERFRREARAIARLSHPNVVNIFRIGDVDGQPYIAYELVAGKSLDRTATPLPWPVVLHIAVRIARGLDAVHRAGVLHRDVKPANVVVSDSGDVKLIDFGLASLTQPERPAGEARPRDAFTTLLTSATAPTVDNLHLTRPGSILGTPAFIAPEIWCGDPASTRSDVWALGMTLYELLVGRLPHDGLPFEELGKYLLLQDLPSLLRARPDVPETFAAIVDRCLRRDPAERFPGGGEVREMLETAERIFVRTTGAAAASALSLEPADVAVGSSFVRVKTKGAAFARS